MLIRADVCRDVGGFDPAFDLYEDTVFLAKVSLRTSAIVSGDCSAVYRLHPESTCFRAEASGEWSAHGTSPARRAYLEWLEGHLAAEAVDDEEVVRLLRRELRPYRQPARHAAATTTRSAARQGTQAGTQPRSSTMSAAAPAEVSIVVPTIGRIEMLDACLRSLLACSPRASEVIVVDQSERDDVADLVAAHRRRRQAPAQHRAWDQPRDERGPRGSTVRPGARHARRLRRRGRLGRPRDGPPRRPAGAHRHGSCRAGGRWRSETRPVGQDRPVAARLHRRAHLRRAVPEQHGAVATSASSTSAGSTSDCWFAEDNDLSYRWLLARARTPLRAGHGGLAPRLADQRSSSPRLYVEYWRSQGVFYAKHLLRRDRAMVGFLAGDAHQAARYAAARLLGRARPWSDDRSGIWRGLPAGLSRASGGSREPMPDTRADPTALLIVSPHLDDAVLSCFALLTGPAPADVLTVFAGAPVPPRVAWSERAMGFADSDATMTARRAEDARALEGLTRATDTMDLLDEDYIDDRRTPADADALRTRVSAWVAGNPGGGWRSRPAPGGVLGRVGARLERLLGERGKVTQHPDHVFVRDAVAELVGAGELDELLLYEELPYLWHGEAAAESRRVARRTAAAPRAARAPRRPRRKGVPDRAATRASSATWRSTVDARRPGGTTGGRAVRPAHDRAAVVTGREQSARVRLSSSG